MSETSWTTERFPKQRRLLTSSDFRRVFDAKTSAADDVLIVYVAMNERCTTRLGMSVSRKIGNAVTRNRWKRHIREAFRRQRGQLPENMDIVVLPRKGVDPNHLAVQRSLAKLSKRLAKRLAD